MLKKIEEHYIDENPIEIIQITLVITITYLVLQLPKITFDIISMIIETEHNKMFYIINCVFCIIYYLAILIIPILVKSAKIRK